MAGHHAADARARSEPAKAERPQTRTVAGGGIRGVGDREHGLSLDRILKTTRWGFKLLCADAPGAPFDALGLSTLILRTRSSLPRIR